MSDRFIQAQIDQNLCDSCAECVATCRPKALSIQECKVRHDPALCIGCLHCEAICPQQAIRVAFGDEEALQLTSVPYQAKYIAPGGIDIELLTNFMRSRRSCSSYLDRAVAKDVLDDLVKVAICAPSGTNNQLWTFHILPTRETVLACGELTVDFYRRLNALAKNPLVRTIGRVLGKPDLHNYYQKYYTRALKSIALWDAKKADRLFHGATAAIVIGAKPGGSSPREDANLAAQNIMLGAHAMGLGSCFLGLLTIAMDRDKSINRALAIPAEEKIYAAIALGYPKLTFKRLTRRVGVHPHICRL